MAAVFDRLPAAPFNNGSLTAAILGAASVDEVLVTMDSDRDGQVRTASHAMLVAIA